MATQKPQILLTLDDELLKKVEDFRYTHRIPSRSEAIRQLIEEGLRHHTEVPGEEGRTDKDADTLFPESPKSKQTPKPKK